jgi:thioredoxin-like negative regulator of GroEL
MSTHKGNVSIATQCVPPIRAPAPEIEPIRPLFRKIDYLTFLITFAAVWTGFYLTLAPEVTLEDSGELATGSFYAGIPHSPGYPVWTVYTWLWTVLVPFKNIAWRVALGEATGGALAAGLVGLLVSRGSSLLMEGVQDLKAIVGRRQNLICMVSGFVAGMLLGFNGFMWSQSVIVEVYAFSVANFMLVLVCLLRWLYAPHQRRFLFFALFFHGLCFTNHQTLIVAAMGVEVAIAAADFRLGRYLWLGNTIVYLAGLILVHLLPQLEANPAVFAIFNVVGLGSLLSYLGFIFLSREGFRELCLDACMAGFFILLAAAAAPQFRVLCLFAALAAASGWAKLACDTWKLGHEWLALLFLGGCWLTGAAFYLYMPLAGMTNPPMEWSYPRTVDGFFHAITRGQYGQTNPTDILGHPGLFGRQLLDLASGIIEQFNCVYAFLALIPFLLFSSLHKRERAWLIGLAGIYLCLGVLLLILLNPSPDRQSQELNRVFFTASHTVVAILIGYGLTLTAAFMAANYSRFRPWGLLGGAVAILLAIGSFWTLITDTFFGAGANVSLREFTGFVAGAFTRRDQFALPVYAGLILLGMAAAFTAGLWLCRRRPPLPLILALFAVMPLHSILAHWSENEQHNHWFGYWFGHDIFTPPFKAADGKPLYPQMAKNAILFGGTDPGRFCPTYMIFCDSFLPHHCQPADDQDFDRRDVHIITQNSLVDDTYLDSIRAQYHRSAQIDPPFFQELLRSRQERNANVTTNSLARAVQPLDRVFTAIGDRIEKRRRTCTSWFTPGDFIDLPALAARLSRPQDPLSHYIQTQLSADTRRQMASQADEPRLRQSLASDLNRLLDAGPLYEPVRFKRVALSDDLADFVKQNPQTYARVRLNRLLLETAYPGEIAHSLAGVYPDREIYTPSPKDARRCSSEYLADAQHRLSLNQLKAGEEVKVIGDQIQIEGQVALMSINGLLAKVIFDRNPKNEFFVEESLPLDWMYPCLSPFGIIMKVNRQPLPELNQEIINRDHQFWSQYSQRLIGNWIDYDTPLKDICAWIEKIHLRRDFTGFTGDRKFIRDDQAQKAFAKLRTCIAGLYAWRVSDPANHDPKARQRMIKEADFAFRQALALCPYHPDAIVRYINFLLSLRRFDDALLVVATGLKFDPYNPQFLDLPPRLRAWQKQAAANPSQQRSEQLENELRDNPADFQSAFDLASLKAEMHQTRQALEILDGILNHPQADAGVLPTLALAYSSLYRQLNDTNALEGALDKLLNHPKADRNTAMQIARQYAELGNNAKLEVALERLVRFSPGSPEAWYDLAAIKAVVAKPAESLTALQQAFALSDQRLRLDPNASDLLAKAQTDPRFSGLRQMPEFKQLSNREHNP